MTINKLSDLKPADYNPREISDQALKGLKYSLEEFGDISGITFNQRTGNLVSGHQRVKALQDSFGDIEILDNKIITPAGEFNVRIVDWDIEKEKAANVAANTETIQGEFTDDLIPLVEEINLHNPEASELLMLSAIDIISDLKIDEKIEIDTSEMAYKPQYGVIVICDDDKHQEEVFNKLSNEGYKLKVVTT